MGIKTNNYVLAYTRYIDNWLNTHSILDFLNPPKETFYLSDGTEENTKKFDNLSAAADWYARTAPNAELENMDIPNLVHDNEDLVEAQARELYNLNTYRKSKGLQEVDFNGDLRTTHYPSWTETALYGFLTKSRGNADLDDVIRSQFKEGYYDGKYHYGNLFNDLIDNNLNYVRAYTLADYTGFKPSDSIGRGRYAGSKKFGDLPYVLGNFYGDTLYFPTKTRSIYNNNIGKTFWINKSEMVKDLDNQYLDNTFDAGHHAMKLEPGTVLFEDVFDINTPFIDRANYPFIVNQRVPVVFTDDEEKINRFPKLTEWMFNPRDSNDPYKRSISNDFSLVFNLNRF